MTHLVVAGGGTGGHLFPGLAVAEEFTRLHQDARVTFVGTESGIEARVIPETEFDFELVEVDALKGGRLLERAKSMAGLPKSGLQAFRLLGRLDPDIVLSVGGYAAGPTTLIASMRGIVTALMEQNSYAGLTNRLLSRVVDRAFLTFEETAEQFGDVPVSVFGNPVRRQLLELAETFEYDSPEADDLFHILIIGGSGGAGSFNRHIPGWLKSMGDLQQRLVVRHQSGMGRSSSVEPGYEDFDGEVEVVEFIDEMHDAYRWCDLLICRAGATTIAEVINLGIPAIFVPFPDAADDHQRANARSVVEAGGGVMLPDDELDSDRSRNLLRGLVANPSSLGNLARGARALARPDAGQKIAEKLGEMIE